MHVLAFYLPLAYIISPLGVDAEEPSKRTRDDCVGSWLCPKPLAPLLVLPIICSKPFFNKDCCLLYFYVYICYGSLFIRLNLDHIKLKNKQHTTYTKIEERILYK